jgi:hypothetical protein
VDVGISGRLMDRLCHGRRGSATTTVVALRPNPSMGGRSLSPGVPRSATKARTGDRRQPQRVKPSSSSFAQAIACGMVCPDTSFDTIVGMVPRFHICTAMSGGADEPVM